jgi:rhodanese-related sulfurtransferase
MAREIDANGLEAAGDVQLVDVRTQEERDAGRIAADTAHIPFDELLGRAAELDRGGRSSSTAAWVSAPRQPRTRSRRPDTTQSAWRAGSSGGRTRASP